MNVLVTGGAGFIGSHLVDRLLKLGHHVITIDDLSTGKKAFLSEILQHPNHTFIQGSILDRHLIKDYVKQSDLIYHLAAVLGVKTCVENPLKVIEGNLDGTRAVVEEAFEHHKKVVFASTSEVYGKNTSLPFSEDDDRVLGSTSINRWCYATAKAMDEHICLAYSHKGLPVTIIRYFNAYGPRATSTAYGGVIPRFVHAAVNNQPLYVHGTGEQRRCFTYIDDIIEGTILTGLPVANGKIFNLGSRFEITIRELANKVVQLANSKSDIINITYDQAYGEGYEDMNRRIPDLSRSMNVLGYNPKSDLETGLLTTIEWYRNLHTFRR